MGELRHGLVVPEREERWPNFGALALLVAAGGLLTGVFLAFNYAPTLEAARASVAYIESKVALGGFLRGLHHWAGNFAIALAALHGARLFWNGAYKTPRRLLWVTGCLIFLVFLGFAYTGYLLPGDERAYAGMTVMEGVAGATPGVGADAGAIVRGGGAISSATLSRLYAVHTVVLPAALLALVVAFVVVWRRRGPARHWSDDTDAVAPAWPAALRRDAAAAVVVMVLLAACAALLQPALGPPPDLEGGASPDARPEWFFLWVNELLYRAKGGEFFIAGLLPGLLVGLFVGLPWLSRGGPRDPRRRKPELVAAAVLLLALGGLTLSALARPTAAPAAGDAQGQPAALDGDAAAFEEQAQAVLKKFRCGYCHALDGAEAENEMGPPLDRRGTSDKPPFHTLYARELFRLRVGDPRRFWSDTGMAYKPRRLKPTPTELALLERWFYLDAER